MVACNICGKLSGTIRDLGGWQVVDCPRCGSWTVLGDYPQPTLFHYLDKKLGDWGDKAARHRRSQLSHIVRRQQTGANVVNIPVGDLEAWHLDDPLPTPAQQLDDLVLLLGERQPSRAEWALPLTAEEISAWIGCLAGDPERELEWLLQQIAADTWIERPAGLARDALEAASPLSFPLRLRLNGWNRYFELKSAQVTSRSALVAMKFGDPELNNVVETCFRPAVERAGFRLRVLTDGQPAGSIDDHLRVALRTSRFVIADLTHGNQGAYWEAGYTEGLGRPVIYTCKQEVWDQAKTHFDTNHLVTIIWNPGELRQAQDQLTATIRATLPGEAKLED
jgi:hypothetical protein